MNKKTTITVSLLTILFSTFLFIHLNEYMVDKQLLDKTAVSFYFYVNDNINTDSFTSFLKRIEDFSIRNDVEISQYSYLTADNIDIYTTQKNIYSKSFQLPQRLYNYHLIIHDFDELENVGFNGNLYINTTDIHMINNLENELKDICNISYRESPYKGHLFLANSKNSLVSISLFPYFLIFIFCFGIILYFFYSQSECEYNIYRLWGYPNIHIHWILSRSIIGTLVGINIFYCLIIWCGIYSFSVSGSVLELMISLLILNSIALLVILFLSYIIYSITLNNRFKNRNRQLSLTLIVSYILKVLLIMILSIFIETLITQKEELTYKRNNLSIWDSTENLYIINESYLPFNDKSLEDENIHNEKVYDLYKELSDQDKVFIMNTLNYEHSNRENFSTDNEDDLNYYFNITNENDYYSPYGKCIVVDKNYLKHHLIKSIDQDNTINLIDDNPNVLNVLVPLKYKEKENIINSSFSEWFYLQKVEVPNIYREGSNLPLLYQNPDELHINIIYIEDNHQYFTYCTFSGNSLNMIEDPIIIVYTENIDNSYIASCVSCYMFMKSNNQYSALQELSPITKQYNIPELNSVTSVYNRKGKEIKQVEESIKKTDQNIMIISLLMLLLLIVITYSYYLKFSTEIIIHTLFGHCFIKAYMKMFCINICSDLIILLIMLLICEHSSLPILVLTILLIGTEFITAFICHTYLNSSRHQLNKEVLL
ncbi:MAG: hypothetical protein IKS48_01235 [Eubacterium sp.]|nr:hypothetical protein [Eubacterium sp.]